VSIKRNRLHPSYCLKTEAAREQYGSTTSSAEDHAETTTAEVCIGIPTLGPVEGISKFSAKLERLSFFDGKEFC
jgi:hypothetical protein